MKPTSKEGEGSSSETSQSSAELPEPLLWSAKTLAAALSIGVRTLWRLDAMGRTPRAVRLGRSKRWQRQEILEWIEAGCPDRREWEARRLRK